VAIAIGSRDAVPLPDVSLTSIEGNNVALAGFAGKPTVINLWAAWCPPCRREMPVLEKAQDANPDTNFVFVNQGERPDTIRRFIGHQGLKLHNVLVDERLQAGAALGAVLRREWATRGHPHRRAVAGDAGPAPGGPARRSPEKNFSTSLHLRPMTGAMASFLP
jgi:peroxiredoxin